MPIMAEHQTNIQTEKQTTNISQETADQQKHHDTKIVDNEADLEQWADSAAIVMAQYTTLPTLNANERVATRRAVEARITAKTAASASVSNARSDSMHLTNI